MSALRSSPGADLGAEWVLERLERAVSADIATLAGDDRPGLSAECSKVFRPAAVLIGLVAREAEPRVLLTQRTAHLRDHAGQISFPGGRIEEEDRDCEHAALREAHEEIGLTPSAVRILGRLPVYRTVTGFAIHPVVGWIEPPVEFTLDPFEVEELFEVPISYILDTGNHQRGSYERDGEIRQFYRLPYDNRNVWGATAGILVNFSRLLSS